MQKCHEIDVYRNQTNQKVYHRLSLVPLAYSSDHFDPVLWVEVDSDANIDTDYLGWDMNQLLLVIQVEDYNGNMLPIPISIIRK